MQRLFRKARKLLLAKGKVPRYLAYALGEIILLVIGILIALAINNRNQQRQLHHKERIYLEGLHAEFSTSKAKLAELMVVNQDNLQDALKLLACIDTMENPFAEQACSRLLFDAFSRDIAFNPNNSLLQEMLSSGSLKDISDADLRIQLTNWISAVDDVAKQEYELGIQRTHVLDLFRSNKSSLRTLLEYAGQTEALNLPQADGPVSNAPLLRSQALENNVLLFVLASQATETAHYQPLMDRLNGILHSITHQMDAH